MQPVAIAVSSTGIAYLLKTLLGNQIAAALRANLVAPDYSTPVPNFTWWAFGRVDELNISVSLTGGTLKSFTPMFTGYVQGPTDNSQFAVTMTATDLDVSYKWTEQYDEFIPHSQGAHYGPTTYPYDIAFDSFAVTAIFKMSVGASAYSLSYVSSTVQAGNVISKIPQGSVLNHQEGNVCSFATHVSAATAAQLSNIDFGKNLSGALTPIFASIASSGKLGPVEFDFLTPGDSGLVFPTGGGIQIGAKGSVLANGATYPATPPSGLALPPIPTGSPPPDVAYCIQDYEVNALFWGFNAAGALKTTLVSGDLADPQALETNTYQGGSLNNLFMKYPGQMMSGGLSAVVAPTVSFQAVYVFDQANLAEIQAAVGPTVWSQVGAALTEMINQTFSSQAGLEAELALLNSALPTYAPIIEQKVGRPGVVVTHTTQCVLNVLLNGLPTPVITFNVAQTFLMEQLQLGPSSNGTAQSVLFAFSQPIDNLPRASFVSSTIPGVNQGDFGDVWNALRPNWQNVLDQIGKAGLPLPHIPGFGFVFASSLVTVVPPVSGADGYLSVVASMTYSQEHLTQDVRLAIERQVSRAAA
jgi:hypothetical protein